MDCSHVIKMMKDELALRGYGDVIVKYWGHDPDDLEMGMKEDHLTGFYDVYMVPDEKASEFRDLWYEVAAKIAKETLFEPMMLSHDVSATKEYYPHIYAQYLKTKEERDV